MPGNRSVLSRPISISSVVNALLVFAVLFPFVPRLVPSSDTQPTFLLAFVLSLVVAVAAPSVGARLYRISLPGATALLFGTVVIYAWLLVANATQEEATIPARLVSFVQFGAAAVWGYAGKFRWNRTVLYRALVVYVVFTVVYFATNGAIEDALIQSRTDGAAFLFASGRGARTLAPEPSFFALHIFNVFVLSRIVALDDTQGHRVAFTWFALIVGCLASSLSAYGVLLLLVVLVATYPRVSATLGVVVVASFGAFYSQLLAWDSVRAVKAVLTLIESRGSVTELLVLDASFSRRIASFVEYVTAFRDHPFVGNGLSLYQGGGFVSVVAGFGILGLLFFVAVVGRIVRGQHDLDTKAILLTWLLLNFVSGPVGVPLLGVIVGMLFRSRGDTVPGLHPEAGPSYAPVATARRIGDLATR